MLLNQSKLQGYKNAQNITTSFDPAILILDYLNLNSLHSLPIPMQFHNIIIVDKY